MNIFKKLFNINDKNTKEIKPEEQQTETLKKSVTQSESVTDPIIIPESNTEVSINKETLTNEISSSNSNSSLTGINIQTAQDVTVSDATDSINSLDDMPDSTNLTSSDFNTLKQSLQSWLSSISNQENFKITHTNLITSLENTLNSSNISTESINALVQKIEFETNVEKVKLINLNEINSTIPIKETELEDVKNLFSEVNQLIEKFENETEITYENFFTSKGFIKIQKFNEFFKSSNIADIKKFIDTNLDVSITELSTKSNTKYKELLSKQKELSTFSAECEDLKKEIQTFSNTLKATKAQGKVVMQQKINGLSTMHSNLVKKREVLVKKEELVNNYLIGEYDKIYESLNEFYEFFELLLIYLDDKAEELTNTIKNLSTDNKLFSIDEIKLNTNFLTHLHSILINFNKQS